MEISEQFVEKQGSLQSLDSIKPGEMFDTKKFHFNNFKIQ